jgi:UDP-N-acetylmuramoyl-tripeptide--D-alanyl-D-alanine ligase
MITLTFEEIARVVEGTIRSLSPTATTMASPVIDSRKAEVGTFFVALPGERVDGNAYCEEAIESGAEFVLCTVPIDAPSILVEDSLIALTKLAKYVREKMPQTTFIGITGSQGKTTTKDLLRSILSLQAETIAPTGSFNNEIGVPVTILSCSESTRFCILEMGARHTGDIKYLCSIAKPQIGLVLVVGSAHLGEFGSFEGIAKTKGELIDSLPGSGIAILGSYDNFTPHMGEGGKFTRIIFGEKSDCDVRAADIEFREGRAHFDLVTSAGRAPVGLRLLGLHQIANALAAAAVATAVGIEIESIAAALSVADIESKWRMELHEEGGILIVNDAYNANPESTTAALQTLALLAQERGGVSWAFLGKMHELGESEVEEHLRIGRLSSELGIDQLVSVGTDLYLNGLNLDFEAGDEMTTHYFLTQEEALGISKHFSIGDVILVKASRAEHLDELAEKLIALARSRALEEGIAE